jgi:thiosulfate dehydrogenase
VTAPTSSKEFSMSSRIFVIAALLGAGIAGSAWAQAPAGSSELVTRGAYIARLGDCVACHTGQGGRPMAGGLALKTPFGSMYSTNITPDAQAGIGRYTFEQFDRAMRQGVAVDGHNLYPAMPYPSYATMTGGDMQALYAYLTQAVAPVRQPNRASDMSWPFSMRWGLAVWNWAFVRQAVFVPEPAHDAVWNRGAYLAQGLGHCGSCHTPRGIGFQEKAMTHAGPTGGLYLAGETVDAWRAPSLRNLWTVADTVAMLKTGQNRFGSVSGSMVEVIHHSTQHFTDTDLVALASYLKSLPPGEHELPMPAVPAGSAPEIAANLFTSEGGLAYAQFCVDCHRMDGHGVKDVFPPLAGNTSALAADPATLLHIMLTGWKTAQTQAYPRVYTMPAFSRLSDAEIAQVLTFVRESWGNRAGPLTAVQVGRMRAELKPAADRTTFATPRLAAMLKEPNALQLVRGMRLHLETKALLPDNVANDLNCTSCHLNAGTVADGSPFVGLSAFFPSYAPRAGRVITLEERINGCFLRSMHGKPLPVDSPDMRAMVAYFDWMKGATRASDQVPGRGVGKIDVRIQPDPANGRNVYAAQCAACHGREGEGLHQADGGTVYPPLWGERSFNIGAGMARTYTAAAFVKRNMPIGAREQFPLGQGGLTDQQAVDVAAYFSHEPRPDFAGKVKDWPKDPKPADARY